MGVPGTGPPAQRLARIAGAVGPARASATGRPPIAFLQPLLRLLAVTGLYRRHMEHQRRIHTLVSNVRGPDRSLTVAGVPVAAVIPISVGEAGNLTVSFVALSYAGELTVTVADPDRVPDLPVLSHALQAELDALTRS